MFETKELYPPEDELGMYPDNCGEMAPRDCIRLYDVESAVNRSYCLQQPASLR